MQRALQAIGVRIPDLRILISHCHSSLLLWQYADALRRPVAQLIVLPIWGLIIHAGSRVARPPHLSGKSWWR